MVLPALAAHGLSLFELEYPVAVVVMGKNRVTVIISLERASFERIGLRTWGVGVS
jgi:hypothetical protein